MAGERAQLAHTNRVFRACRCSGSADTRRAIHSAGLGGRGLGAGFAGSISISWRVGLVTLAGAAAEARAFHLSGGPAGCVRGGSSLDQPGNSGAGRGRGGGRQRQRQRWANGW
jgi:hypothetical protein